jgi:thymidylate synthase
MEQVRTQLARTPMKLPTLHIKRKPESLFDYKYDDFELIGYESWPAIKAPVAV